MDKKTVLIVDDSPINRAMLTEMLSERYKILQANNGLEAVELLQKHNEEISIALLDVVMPEMDGFEVLSVMRRTGWIESIPVIMISSESAPTVMDHAYDLGAAEYIGRPFDVKTVIRRVGNTIALYSKQRRLENLVTEQMLEKEKNNLIMVEVLSHIVEFRNGESGLHVLHIRVITDALLKRLAKTTDAYRLTPERISVIANASALHDIGKISIPEHILNKPGKLTPEEYETMKRHSVVGAEMLESASFFRTEELVKTARDICRWHHERYDGRGYPDGLKGDEIPIAAQVVALADVYDALTNKRVYKPAYSHERAIEMILGGECGAFNPLLLECLKEAAPYLKKELKIRSASGLVENFDSVPKQENASNRILSLLKQEGVKNKFFNSVTDEIQFEYSNRTDILTISERSALKLGLPSSIIAPEKSAALAETFAPEDFARLKTLLSNAEPSAPTVSAEFTLRIQGEPKRFEAIARPLWVDEENAREKTGSVGKFTPLGDGA